LASLKDKTARGLLWGGLNSGVGQLVGLAFGIVMGRLLSPSDYGMMAMISVFSLVATALQDSGFKTALANEEAPTDRDYNSVFWFNILMGAGLYALLFVAAPLIATYYHDSRIVALCRYAFLSIPIASMATAQSAWLFKNLRAKQQAKASIVAVVLSSLTGLAMALRGMAYWSLATQGLVYVALNALLCWHYSPWRPTLRGISFAPVRRMFRFSCKILATTITTHINNNVLNILLGHYFTQHDTGNYNQAYQWNFKCFSLVQNMVSQVAQPVLVELHAQPSRRLAALRKLTRFTAFVSFPLLLGFALVSHEFIVLALTEKWAESAAYLRLLCLAGAVMPLSSLLSSMIVSAGRSGTFFWCTFSLGIIQIAAMLLLWPYGIDVMVRTYVGLNLAWLFVWHYFARRVSGYGLVSFLKDILPFALIAAATMAIASVATSWIDNLWLLLASRIIIAATIYVAAMLLLRVEIFRECLRFVLKRK